MVTIKNEGDGIQQTWTNGTDQAIFDCLIKGYDASGNPMTPSTFGIIIKVDGNTQPWNTINGFEGTGWKKKVTDNAGESCGEKHLITVESPDDLSKVEVWFTNASGCPILAPIPLETTESTEVAVLPAGDSVFGTRWSACLRNQTDYLVLGLSFSESPNPVAMNLLHSSRLGGTAAATRKVSFEYPLQPRGGWAVISTRYASTPSQDTTVSCTPLISKVIPESADPRMAFNGGSGVAVPDITLREVDTGSIKIQGGTDAIVLRPRERFAFASVNEVSVISGNLQLGVPSVVDGEIHIPILASSSGEGKSTVRITGITIDTQEGLRKGVISVREEEPSGNSSNFPYAYFDPSE